MYLLLGDRWDPCCQGVLTALEAEGHAARILSNPLIDPSRFAWRLDNERSVSRFFRGDDPPVESDEISGVLVRGAGWLDPTGWRPDDLIYAQGETQAALLAWLWSLHCPVVGRRPPAIWYRPRPPLPVWYPLLRRCGLPTPETLVTNDPDEAHDFGGRVASKGMAGIIYGPLTSEQRYAVTTEEEWKGLAALQQHAPVCLSCPHGAVQTACVVGETVVWEDGPPPEAARLEPALRRFAVSAGLDFVQLALAPAPDEDAVVDIETRPRFELFGEAARRRVVAEIVRILTGVASRNGDKSVLIESTRPT